MPKRTNDGVKKRCAHKRKSWNDCACPWWFRFYHGGREYAFSLTKIAHARGEEAPKSREQAITWRDRLRSEIRAGTFVDPDAAPAPARVETRLTFGDVGDEYVKRHVRTSTRRADGRREMEILIALARRAEIPAAKGARVRLETKPFADVTKADIEAVRDWRRRTSKGGSKGGEVGINRLLSRLRHMFNWAIVEGYRTDTPFRSGPVTVIRLESSVEGARTRRLDAVGEQNEERRLLEHADPHVRAVLVAALSTGCRVGEILSLQWSQIRRDAKGEPRWFELPAAKTKTDEARVIPIGDRLRAELSMRRHAPDGREHPADAYVFGDEAGAYFSYDRLRRLWEDAVLRAHGHTPVRMRGKLTPESRAPYQAIGLHLHDLRREFASRLLEASADLHDVQLFLGHANITTTSTYLRSTPVRLKRALDKLEAAGFGHYSDKQPETGTSTVPDHGADDRANSLN